MVEVVNRSQQVITAALTPKAAYTRVVSCVQFCPTGPGAVYSHTPKLGNNLWLYKVKVWGAPKPINMANQTLFRIMAGKTQVTSAADILLWENIMTLVSPGFTDEPWTLYDGSGTFEWSMKRHFEGTGIMLGFWAERGPVGIDELYASFEISEG